MKVAEWDTVGNVKDSVMAPPPNRVYGVMALELIGTPKAYQVLGDVAQTDTEVNVRGEALKSLAQNYYFKTLEDSLSPDKEIRSPLAQRYG